MLATMYGSAVMSYVSAIFLSTYPASYLAYFYLSLAILFIIINKLTASYLSRHYKKGTATLLILFVVVIFLSWQLPLHFSMPMWWPFILCVFLITSGKFLGNNYWNGVNQVLKLREFKQNSDILGASVAAGGIIMGLAAALIVKKTTVTILLPIMGSLLLVSLMMLQSITVKEAESSLEPTTPFRYQYKLQKLLLVFVLVILIFSTLVDYVFKYQVKLSFKAEEIAIYTSKLSFLSNIIILLVQFFGVKPVLQRLGIFVFILQIPILLIACALAVIFKPNLTTISLLLIAYSVGSSSITDLAFQLLGNALPTKVRGISKLHIKGITLFIGSIISAGLILSLSNKATPRVISIFLLLLAIFFVFLARKITKAYSETLKESLESHHIVYSDDFYLAENMQQWGDVIEKSFSSKDYAVKLIGYELLAHKKYAISDKFLDKVSEDLQDSNPAIRIEAIKLLSRHMNEKYLEIIKKRLEVETDNEVIFWLFQAFDFKHHEGALEIAQKYLDSDQMLRQVGSISILLKFGTITDAILALNHVMAMISSSDPSARIAAARILSLFDLHGAVESLSQLIVDPDVQVSIAAIQSASAHPHKEYIPSLMQQMAVKYASYYAGKAIFSFGEEVIPLLFQRINEVSSPVFQRAAIRCISRTRGEKADNALAELMSNASSHIRNNAVKSIAYRAMNMDLTRAFQEQIAQRVEIEKRHISDYKKLLQLELTLFERQEINALIFGATSRVLYLLSTDNPKKLMPLVALILRNMADRADNDASEVLDEGIELLDSYLHKSHDRTVLIEAFAEPKGDIADDILLSKERLGPWLTKVFSVKSLTYEGAGMHDLEKLVILRGCSLFKDLSADILLALAERLEVVLMPKETILFREGDLPGDLYIVAGGEIAIMHDKQTISSKYKFDFIGELSILDEKPRTATAVAVTEVVVLKMSQIEYDRILDDFPDILRTIAQTLLGYLRQYQN
jgi:hypothetical protein